MEKFCRFGLPKFPDGSIGSIGLPWLICDYGERPFLVNRERLVCLLTGCFRIADMRAVGGYRELLGITPGRLGSVEDAELYERACWS